MLSLYFMYPFFHTFLFRHTMLLIPTARFGFPPFCDAGLLPHTFLWYCGAERYPIVCQLGSFLTPQNSLRQAVAGNLGCLLRWSSQRSAAEDEVWQTVFLPPKILGFQRLSILLPLIRTLIEPPNLGELFNNCFCHFANGPRCRQGSLVYQGG